MKIITANDILSWQPCDRSEEDGYNYSYELTDGKFADFSGTALDVLKITDPLIPDEDRLWVVLLNDVLPDTLLRAFACDCAERMLPIYEQHHPEDLRPRRCIETVRAWLAGNASWEEVGAAQTAADAAARDAASAAAWAAARCAAIYAAWAAAGAAADAAAIYAARDAARDAAGQSERRWQVERLIKMLEVQDEID